VSAEMDARGRAVPVARPQCRVNLNAGQRGAEKSVCPAEAAYRAWLDDCNVCIHIVEFDSCQGHPVCEEHGALLRTTALKERDPGTPRSAPRYRAPQLARICTLDPPDLEAGQ
jgi:hypothetical protein